MVYIPRHVDTIKDSIQNRLEGQISGLTNFTETSFNNVWNEAFSERFRDNEIALAAVQLNGWIDYAGGPVTEEDLSSLDISNSVTAEEVNEYMSDEDLDNLAEVVLGDDPRGDGEFSDGMVTFETSTSGGTIPENTSVGTQPDADGDFFEYEVFGEDANTPGDVEVQSGTDEVTAFVIATDTGSEYNVGAGTVTYLPSPPSVVNGVTNNTSFSGGTDQESNEDLRARAKEAIFNTSGGGTVEGVRGYVDSTVEDVESVSLREYPGGNDSTNAEYIGPGGPGGSSSTSPFADVIVDGGETTALETAIADSRPVAVQHNLVRPTFINVGVSADVSGSDINTGNIETSVTTYLDGLDLGETVVRDKLVQRIMNSDASVDDIESLTISIVGEMHTYDSDNSGGDAPNHPLYKLNKGDYMDDDAITSVIGTLSSSSHEFVEDSDYQEATVDDSDPDAIEWDIGGDDPDEDTDFEVTYTITDNIPVDEYEKADASSVTVNEV